MDVIRRFYAATFLVAVLAVSGTVNAALVSVDWQLAGDNLITRDTTSGLDWLDLTETNNMSHNQIIPLLGSGELFDGWRYASGEETVALWGNFGVDLASSPSIRIAARIDPNIATAALMLGNVYPEYLPSTEFGLLGVTSTPHNANTNCGACAFSTVGAWTSITQALSGYSPLSSSWAQGGEASLNLGHYLVQTSSVPLPAAVWLFGSGLIGLIGVAKYKRTTS